MSRTSWPTTVLTPRLRLRPPTLGDAVFHHEVHTDPRLYRRRLPATRADLDATTVELAGWLDHWRREGYGYWLVEDRVDGTPVGFGGVRRDGADLNLYLRIAHRTHGRGYGREIARAATAWAAQWLPARTVHALTRFDNTPAIRSALAGGLFPTDDPATIEVDGTAPSGSRYGRWAGPLVAGVTGEAAADPLLRAQLLALWHEVIAGGHVGFVRGARPSQVVDVLDDALADTVEGRATLGVLRRFDDVLLGFAWWRWSDDPLSAHTARLSAVQVAPAVRGRNLGRILLSGMHSLARRRGGVDLLAVEHRSGAGVGRFLAGCGYVEVGRLPGWVQPGPGVRRDLVTMVRRVDGAPPVGDADP